MFSSDLSEIFDEDTTETLTVDGVAVAVIPGQVYSGPSDYDGVNRENFDFSAITEVIGTIEPNQQIQAACLNMGISDGLWTVESVTVSRGISEISISRRI